MEEEIDVNRFVFSPQMQDDSSGVIERKKQKTSQNNEIASQDEFVSFSSEEKENKNFTKFSKTPSFLSFDETNEENISLSHQKTPISDTKKQERFSFLKNIKDKDGIKKGENNYDPSTLYISEKDLSKLTDFERQFWTIKKDYFDTIVFFKKGKFYELYEDDAEIGSKLFDLKVTERVNMKMAGFPEKSYEYWAGKFLEQGYKIAKVDQTENMVGKNLREKEIAKKDKIIKRELKEIVTVGTIYNSEHLKSFNANYLLVVYFSEKVSFILYEASLNKIYFDTFEEEGFAQLRNLIYSHEIKEIIYEEKNKINDFFDKMKEKIEIHEISKFRNKENTILENEKIKSLVKRINNNEEFRCLINLAEYMTFLKRESFLETVEIYNLKEKESDCISLDSFTMQNLELLKNNYDGSPKNSLFSVINFCVTGSGQRLLKRFMIHPSRNLSEIKKRQNFVSQIESSDFFPAREILKQIGDLERIYGKLSSPNPHTKDVITFIKALKSTHLLKSKLNEINLRINLPDTQNILNEFNGKYFIEENEIFPEKNSDDELNDLLKKEKEIYEELTKYLKKIKKELKCEIKFKDVGKEIFQMEIPSEKSVPANFLLISTTKTTKRFYTAELKEMIKKYINNEEMIFQSKGSLLRRVIKYLMEYKASINSLCFSLSELDVFFSFAIFSKTYSTVYPSFTSQLCIKGLVNPIYQSFVETDVILHDSDILVLTGPNMGGKSTLMRSICYNVILAQMGMKVFAKKFDLKVFDNIFTRIGASDNLEKGESTFYVELNETSKILHKSTENTFIIMDELGRGTSVKDGQAIATSVLNYLKKKKSTLIFSTHYFSIVDKVSGVNKGFMDVSLEDNEVLFKYKLVKGVAKESLGLSVAKIANLPSEIVKRALHFRNIMNKKE